MEADFKDRVVIVTGASSGIGRALALRLADQGAFLALAARDAERLGILAEECNRRGGKAVPVPTDVSVEGQCQALVEQAIQEYGRLDMLVNNAGMAVVARLEELPDLSLFRQVVDVNFYGMVYCTYYALQHLKASRGRLVNVSSLGGKLAIPYNTSYNSSKFAMQGFSDSLRMELAPAGVSVTVVCPYWVVTEFHERFMNKDGKPKGSEGRAFYTEKMMTADRCAELIIKAAVQRKREILMGPGIWGVWLKMIAPGLVEKISIESVLKPAAARISGKQEKG
jgi:NAD(P)-dependent dehydrogenase (short-subunit alcohol dehydrogenase family)